MHNRLLVVVGALLAASVASAAPPRYTRKPGAVVDVKLSDRAKPIVATTTSKVPAVTGTDVMVMEEHNEPLRREQEAILAELVKQTPDTEPDKPDLMFRLAEHYAKQQRFWRLKSLEPAVPAATKTPR